MLCLMGWYENLLDRVEKGSERRSQSIRRGSSVCYVTPPAEPERFLAEWPAAGLLDPDIWYHEQDVADDAASHALAGL